MESEAARRKMESAKAEEYIGTGKLHKDLTELILLTQIGLVEKFFERVKEEHDAAKGWMEENPKEEAYELIEGHASAYMNVMRWLMVILNERASEYEDLLKGGEKKDE
jgi:hypothetical protein